MSDETATALRAQRRRIIAWLRAEAQLYSSVAPVLQSLALRLECGEDETLSSITESESDTDDLGKGWPT